MEMACTSVCPRANQEVITTQPDGVETQKCEKCEGDCPKGGPCVEVILEVTLQQTRCYRTNGDGLMFRVLTAAQSEPTCFWGSLLLLLRLD